MKNDYLTWYKKLLIELHDREDTISLISNSVD